MELTGYLVLLFVIFAGIASGELLDDFESCMYSEICQDKDGKKNAMGCLNKLSKSDADWCLNFFRQFYKDQTLDFLHMIGIACADSDVGSKAVNLYYDERREYEVKKPVNLKEEKAFLATRDCFMAMMNRCRTKLDFFG